MRKRTIGIKTVFTMLIMFCFFFAINVFASETSMNVFGTSYELADESTFNTNGKTNSSMLCYGKKSLGRMVVVGDIGTQGDYNGTTAYSVNDSICFKYTYNGDFNKKEKTDWQITSSDEKAVNGNELQKKVQDGVIIIQKSIDGKSWEDATEPIYDVFGKANTDKEKDIIYSVSKDEIMHGTYFRVIVAYRMERQTTAGGFMKAAEYERKSFLEEYRFYVCTDKNYVAIRDVNSKEMINNGATILNGFYVDKCGSDDKVTVKLKNGAIKTAGQYDSFVDPGDYYVEITTKLNKKYYYKVKVSAGYSYISLNPTVYEAEKNKGFDNGLKISGVGSSGITSLTNLKIAQSADYTTTKSTINGIDSYGVNGDSATILLHLNYSDNLTGNGWNITDDEYGKKEKELVHGIQTGQVGKGAIIIQTSTTGKDDSWVNVDKGRYASGLYTTNFGAYYDAKEDIVLYNPAGVEKGIYIRILYVYQLNNASEKKTIDCTEEYKFYLCSSELGAVQYHNLSLAKDSFEKLYGDADANQIALLKNAESLISNTGTSTGFRIDKSKNPTVTYTVDKDGKSISVPVDCTFKETGKYDIHLTSKVGTKQDVTIYVDTSSDDEALKNYFGDGFIQGKRIYDEGDYPVYEGGFTSYNLAKVSDNYLPISGCITNVSTGEEIQLEPSRNARKQIITTPGNYTAVFRTGTDSSLTIGDVRVFTFNFKIIAKGTAPGPKNNQKLLEEYSHSNISDSYPLYYGVKYQSASGLPITVAFKDRKSAIDYAYSYEKGRVEELSDGTYKYNGSFLGVENSIKFDENIGKESPKVLYAFAEKAVHLYYFDLSDDSTYMTLRQSDIDKKSNLREYALNRSVVIYNDGEKELLTDLDTLPIISRKPYAYINPGDKGVVDMGYNDFEFIRDKYGCDSNSVVITDCNGASFDIEYGGEGTKDKGVGKQLQDKGCATGVVTITETTVGGDVAIYEAVFIRDDENTSEINLKYYTERTEKSAVLSIYDANTTIEADAFSIESISDVLDPYALVIISKDGEVVSMYAADQFTKGAWSEEGKYCIRVINRLGYGFTINVVVSESDYSVITFDGDGTENTKDIITTIGSENVELPQLTRTGYSLACYKDVDGNIYTEKIDKITFKGNLTLTAQWEAQNVKVTVKDTLGNVIVDDSVDVGTIYSLPKIDVEPGKELVGWMCNGEICSEYIEITNANDVIIEPVIKDIETGDVENVTNEKKKNPIGWILMLVGICGFGGYAAMYIKKKSVKSVPEDKKVSEDEKCDTEN